MPKKCVRFKMVRGKRKCAKFSGSRKRAMHGLSGLEAARKRRGMHGLGAELTGALRHCRRYKTVKMKGGKRVKRCASFISGRGVPRKRRGIKSPYTYKPGRRASARAAARSRKRTKRHTGGRKRAAVRTRARRARAPRKGNIRSGGGGRGSRTYGGQYPESIVQHSSMHPELVHAMNVPGGKLFGLEGPRRRRRKSR